MSTTILPVMAVENSVNHKLSGGVPGRISTTYVSQSSCPSTCPFRGEGCYAEHGTAGIWTTKINKSIVTDINVIARFEAEAILGLSGKNHLRLHTVGDCSSPSAATEVAIAAEEYSSRHGKKVWTYTHAWEFMSRQAWGTISILASCQSVSEAEKAMQKGYAAAIVVETFESNKPYKMGNIIGIPCPAQTGAKESCFHCGLCMHADKLRDNKRAILFAVHGSRKKTAAKSLVVLNS